MWTNDIQNFVNLTQCAQQAFNPFEQVLSSVIGAVATKAVEVLFVAGTPAAFTAIYVEKYTKDKVETSHKNKVDSSISVIHDDIESKLNAALHAIGGGQISAAIELRAVMISRLGPMLIFLDPLGKALKGLEDAAKGKVAQDMICVCGKCACGATATIDSRTHVTITTTSPSTSASAAAGGAAAASSSVGGGGSSTSVTPPTGSGSPPPCPPTGRACDCGCGKLEDSKSKPKSPYERDMTGPEQAVAARRAIEAVAEVWRKEAIIAQLHAIHRLLTESGSGRKREEVHVLGLFQGEVVKIRETPMK